MEVHSPGADSATLDAFAFEILLPLKWNINIIRLIGIILFLYSVVLTDLFGTIRSNNIRG